MGRGGQFTYIPTLPLTWRLLRPQTWSRSEHQLFYLIALIRIQTQDSNTILSCMHQPIQPKSLSWCGEVGSSLIFHYVIWFCTEWNITDRCNLYGDCPEVCSSSIYIPRSIQPQKGPAEITCFITSRVTATGSSRGQSWLQNQVGEKPSPGMVLVAPRCELNQSWNGHCLVSVWMPFCSFSRLVVQNWGLRRCTSKCICWRGSRLQRFLSRTSWWRRCRAPSCGCFGRFTWTRPAPGIGRLCCSKFMCSLLYHSHRYHPGAFYRAIYLAEIAGTPAISLWLVVRLCVWNLG